MASIWIALIGIVSGGALLKLLQLWFGKDKSIRDELRKDLSDTKQELKDVSHGLNDRIDSLEAANDLWKVKYFDLIFAVKTYRLKVYQLALEHNVPPAIIQLLAEDKDLDDIFEELTRA